MSDNKSGLIDGAAVPSGVGVTDMAVVASMTGLEFIQAVAAGKLPAPPISALLNFRAISAERGRVVFAGTPGEQHLNPLGTVHGGFAATLLDSALACAGQTLCEKGYASTSVELKVNFVRAITPETGRLVCEANVVHPGRQLATVEARLTGETDGKLYAHGTQTVSIFKLPF